MSDSLRRSGGLTAALAVPDLTIGKVEARHDPDRIRYGCFLPNLTGLATGPSAPDFRTGI